MIVAMGRRAIPYLLLCLVISSCSEEAPPHQPGELSIAAASSLRPAIDAIVAEWNRTDPAVPARATYGESGALFSQISASAPFDLFLSTDDVYARRLYRSGFAEEPFEYATGTIVVWVPAGTQPPASVEQLADSRFKKIAVATPNLAPYGEAALESLEHGGIYDELKNRLLFGTNASEAADFATSGDADAAFLPLSLVIATDLDQRGSHLVISPDLHDPILHEGVIVRTSPDRDAAAEFVARLLSSEGQELLSRTGLNRVDSEIADSEE